MERTKTAWTEVGDQLASLALKLQLHAEEERSEADAPMSLRTALDRLGDALGQTVDAIKDAVRDPAVKDDVRAAADAFAAALEVTVHETRQAVTTKRR